MLKDYARCVRFESRGNPVRAFRVATGLARARIKHDIGPVNYSLFRLSSIPASRWGDYVTDKQFFLRIFKKHVPEAINQLVDDKALFYQHCIRHGIPTIPIVCGIGQLPSGTVTYAETLEQWESLIESAPSELFIKPVYGAHGNGTLAVRRVGQQIIFGQDEMVGSPQTLFRYLLDRSKKGTALLVQPRVHAHSRLREISSPNGLPTARVVTAFVENRAQVVVTVARLSVGANITDNFSRGSSGNLAVAIDAASGTLSEAWNSARSDWPVMQATDVHPDTGKQISGAAFPMWPDVIDLALRAQNSLPGLKTTGWDIAVTDQGPLLVEANCYYGVAFLEVAYQRGLWPDLSRFYE